jgi:hypothetical protein
MIYEIIQFMNKRYRIPKRQSRMEHPEKLTSYELHSGHVSCLSRVPKVYIRFVI